VARKDIGDNAMKTPDFEWIGQVSEMFAKGECTREEAIQVLGHYLDAGDTAIGESLDLCREWFNQGMPLDPLPPEVPPEKLDFEYPEDDLELGEE